MGAIASLLMVVGGTGALQTASVVTGGPFALIVLVGVWGTIRTFRQVEPVFLTEEEHEASDRQIDPSDGLGD
jgi:glycine betaine transporter